LALDLEAQMCAVYAVARFLNRYIGWSCLCSSEAFSPII
jgi:hypothetical protein